MISSQQSLEDIKNASSHGYLEVHIFDECLKVHAIRHKEEESMDWLEGSRGPVPQTERNFIRWKLRSDHFKWRYDWVPPKTVKSVRLFQILIRWSTPLMRLREQTTLAPRTWKWNTARLPVSTLKDTNGQVIETKVLFNLEIASGLLIGADLMIKSCNSREGKRKKNKR